MSRAVRFHDIRIDGFGVFADETVGPFTPGVNIVLGPNEAGKSTLLAFVRAVLFGFERRNSPDPRYEPLRGGKHGGVLSIVSEGGAVTRLERQSGSGAKSSGALRLWPDGGAAMTGDAAEAKLATLLGGISQRLYQNIFAFSLSELQRLATLQDDEVNAYIYTAGMGVAASVLPDAERHLERRLESLYLPRGKKQVINQYFNRLDDIDRRLNSLLERPARYNDLLAERARLEEQVEKALEEAKRLDDGARRAHRLLEAWDGWQELITNREERERFVRDSESEAFREMIRHKERIEALSRRTEVVRAELERLRPLRVRAREASAEWEFALAALGSGWDAERVTQLDTSVAAKEEARAYRERLERLAVERERATASVREMRRVVPWPVAAVPGAVAVLVSVVLAIGAASPVTQIVSLGLGLSLLAAAVWFRRSAAVHDERTATLSRAAQDEQAALASWRDSLNARALPDSLSPQGALDLMAEVEQARSRWQHLAELLRRLDDGENVMSRFAVDVDDLCRELTDAGALPSSFQGASRTGAPYAEGAPGTAAASAESSAAPPAASAAERDAERAVQTVEQLGARLGVALKRRSDVERLDDHGRRLLQQLRRSAGSAEAWEAMERTLRQSSPDGLRASYDNLTARARQLEHEIADFRTRLGAVGRELEQIEQDEETAALRWERVTVQTRLEDEARSWAVVTLTQALLRAARAQYERERQPGVLRRAASLFERMTTGRFRAVVAPFGESVLEAERADGSRVAADSLSRGTAEQLYLAMRLALAGEFAARSVSLPIVLDDPLVNFDPERLAAAAAVVEQVAEDHQVLLFTCHPHVVEAFTRGRGHASVHELVRRI